MIINIITIWQVCPAGVISKDYVENMAIKKGTYTLASGEKIIRERRLNRLPGHSLN